MYSYRWDYTEVIDSPTPGGALQGKYTLHLCAAWFLALQALIVIESSVLLNSFSQGVFLLMLFLHLSLQANLTLRNLVIFKLNLTITETS